MSDFNNLRATLAARNNRTAIASQASVATRHGVVLLVALGMLALFSVLVVSYVVFSSQMREASYATLQREQNIYLDEAEADDAVLQLIRGTNDYRSAAYGHSVLEDLWGSDGRGMQVAHRLNGSTGAAVPVAGQAIAISNNKTTTSKTTLVKFPTHLATWHDNGTNYSLPSNLQPSPLADFGVSASLDDAFSGRLVTFVEGPLEGVTFRVARSFGRSNTGASGEAALAGCFVIDLAEMENPNVEVNGNQFTVTELLDTVPNGFFYSLGADGAPGIAGFNDDGDGTTDELDEIGASGSDDAGYRFVMNGQPFNGKGINPEGVTGINDNGTNVDTLADIELQYNARLIGPAARSGSTSPEMDEAYDVADFENLFLAWQPSDHRRSNPSATVYPLAVPNAAELNEKLGQHIIPSFHRPAVINYLMHAPIPRTGDAPGFIRRFDDLTGDNNAPNHDGERLMTLVRRLRRAIMRPLNFDHFVYASAFSDLDQDGNEFDGAPLFTGSNPTPILNGPITIPTAIDFATLYQQTEDLARWAINGPWDVDNDGDGIPDSVWVDLNLPLKTLSNGKLVKPMVAPLIQDMDGRINLNVAGNLRHLKTTRFKSLNLIGYRNDAEFREVASSLSFFGRGGGLGPAEIDFSHLFDETANAPSTGYYGPLFHSQLSVAKSNILSTRYGNLLHLRNGGGFANFRGTAPADTTVQFPGDQLTERMITQGATTNSYLLDTVAQIPYAERQASHDFGQSLGQPMDMFGRSMVRRDGNGQPTFDNLGTASNGTSWNEVNNQPYERGIEEPWADDQPFSVQEYAALVENDAQERVGAGRLAELLGEAIEDNEALKRLITVESRTITSAEFTGMESVMELIRTRLNIPVASANVELSRMVAVELRKGDRLDLNRPLGNGSDGNALSAANSSVDDFSETRLTDSLPPPPTVPPNSVVNDRDSAEPFAPQIGDRGGYTGEFPLQAQAESFYAPIGMLQNDFDGMDRNGDGDMSDTGEGTDLNGDGIPERIADPSELLARHLYCLMYAMVVQDNTPGGGFERIPNFPYPQGITTDVNFRNRYAARRIAQWAVNAVDARDSNVAMTRLRYDPDPVSGFSLVEASNNVVWGYEHPEVALTETLAFHDKRLKRNLQKQMNAGDPTVTVDGEEPTDEDPDDTDGKAPDKDMDQFRIPEASAFVEIKNLRSSATASNNQPTYPLELYTNSTSPSLDLGRTVGSGNEISPIWRLAVSEPNPHGAMGPTEVSKSTRFLFDADRVAKELVADSSRPEELDYLQAPAGVDWNDATQVTDYVNDEWRPTIGQVAEIRPVLPAVSGAGEEVTLADDDLNPTNDAASVYNVRLERFVWFTEEGTIIPDPSLKIINDPHSGMDENNVFFKRGDADPMASATLDPDNAGTLLAPGQYAVVTPRQVTAIGQTTQSAAPDYPYRPSAQQLQFSEHTNVGGQYRLDYVGLDGTNQSPDYEEDDAAGYEIKPVLPIIVKGLMPNELSIGNANWNAYDSSVTEPEERVSIGFNISAPLAGVNYYTAPTHRITSSAPADEYPLVDGYRDYDAGIGFHPDEPFDHATSAPLEANGWSGVGTYQEARTIFLQRLADPTRPWDAVDNPYLTIDFMPMDLTTFNGEEDVQQLIDRDGDGNAAEPADEKTVLDPGTGDLATLPRFDSRRKIPDLDRDRLMSALLPNRNTPSSIDHYDRTMLTQRSFMSSAVSVLRETNESPAGANEAYFNFEIGSNWSGGMFNGVGVNTDYVVDPSARSVDGIGAEFRQSLGFVNREYGLPLPADESYLATAPADQISYLATTGNQFAVGSPLNVVMTQPLVVNRPFQSPLDLMRVPAVSNTRMMVEFTPGSTLMDAGNREVPTEFKYLLGFRHKYAEDRGVGTDLHDPANGVGASVPATELHSTLTGNRAGFELIFDFVQTTSPYYDAKHWIRPDRLEMFKESEITATPGSFPEVNARVFNRVVELMRPPFNFIPRHRQPGRINLNTMPDYIRRGGSYSTTYSAPELATVEDDTFDIGENPSDPTAWPTPPGTQTLTDTTPARVSYYPNQLVTAPKANVFANSILFGDGSIFRSFAWAHSTAYELDDYYRASPAMGISSIGEPRVAGEHNHYADSVGTRFGRGFKGFIESRRGYSRSTNHTRYGNPELDSRYPTRFAGAFAAHSAAQIPSMHRFGRMGTREAGTPQAATIRRTHDMSIMRPHPDLDSRSMSATDRADIQNVGDLKYSLQFEETPTNSGTGNLSAAYPAAPAAARALRVSMFNSGLFERPTAELLENFRGMGRDPEFRYENEARLANLTTHQSNVYEIRLTIGYFEVDAATGAVGEEYSDPANGIKRQRVYTIVDRSRPHGFVRGEDLNVENTVLYYKEN